MKYHECMHLGGQQQFHAAHSLYMKVVLRSLNVLNAIVCSSCCWFLSTVRVPFSNIFFRIARYRTDVFWGWALGWRWLKCVDLIQPCPFRIALSTSVFYQTLSSKVLWCQMLSTSFNSLTHRVLQRFTFLHQPIVFNILRPQLSTPQHQLRVFCLLWFVMYERGGPAHQCSHTFQVLGGRAHPGES